MTTPLPNELLSQLLNRVLGPSRRTNLKLAQLNRRFRDLVRDHHYHYYPEAGIDPCLLMTCLRQLKRQFKGLTLHLPKESKLLERLYNFCGLGFAIREDLDQLIEVLLEFIRTDGRDHLLQYPIIAAVQRDRLDIITRIFSYRRDQITSEHNHAGLTTAIQYNRFEIFKYLYQDMSDPLYQKDQLLERASSHNRAEILAWLLDQRTSTDSELLKRLLFRAIEKSCYEVVRLLLDRGVDPNATTRIMSAERTALERSLEVLFLRQPGRKLSLNPSIDDRTERQLYDDRISIARLLLDRGAGVRLFTRTLIRVPHGHNNYIEGMMMKPGTLFSLFLGSPGKLDDRTIQALIGLIDALIEKGADPNDTNSSNTCLKRAVRDFPTAIVKHLLDRGADPNFVDKNRAEGDTTALHLAIMKGSPAKVQVLLEAGADPTKRDPEGRTTLELARYRLVGARNRSACQEIVDLLTEASS